MIEFVVNESPLSEEEHISFQYNNIIGAPTLNIPSMWSQKYAEEIASFISLNPNSGVLTNTALGKLLLDNKWVDSADITVLNGLHLAEAETRNISNWSMQHILEIQGNLYSEGCITDTNLVEQRKEIIAKLLDIDKDGTPLDVIGERVCGLELCAPEVWILDQISPELAKELQDKITEKFGYSKYEYTARAWLAFHHGDDQTRNEFYEKSNNVSDEANQMIFKYLTALPKNLQIKFSNQLKQNHFQIFKKRIQEQTRKIPHKFVKVPKK